MIYSEIAVQIPNVLLPKEGVDMKKWSVIACDQYTSQPEIWDEVVNTVGSDPSTYFLMLPELYLNYADKEDRIKRINDTMRSYFEKKIFKEHENSMIYCERTIANGTVRKGLILAVDLERFDFSPKSQSLIRPTEGTIIERIPPRLQIRKDALVELPHIMLLIDDASKSIIEPIGEKAKAGKMEKVYDFDLMIKNNHLTGYKVHAEEDIKALVSGLKELMKEEEAKKKYDLPADFPFAPLLFAVGDGNHSLATAKTHWENVKKTMTDKERADHPARFALVEIVNLFDDSLEFEPIHRVVFHMKNHAHFFAAMKEYMEKTTGGKVEMLTINTNDLEIIELQAKCMREEAGHPHVLPILTKEKNVFCVVRKPKYTLEVATLQIFLDDYLNIPENKTEKTEIDYIHGDHEVFDLSMKNSSNMGFTLPPMAKTDLFKSVILNGPLPRKTFSMGVADDKRVYTECKSIVKL